MSDNVKKDYLLPKRILRKEGDVQKEEVLLTPQDHQISLSGDKYCLIKGKASLILDFGKEIRGGIRILNGYGGPISQGYSSRIRFGESVSETSSTAYKDSSTNDHSTRDMVVHIPDLSDQEFGLTGFRFVRIDSLTDDTRLYFKQILAFSTYLDLEEKGSFHCSDDRLNEIYEISKRTAHLCLQNGVLWDGIKRDCLMWIGDMEVENMALLDIYGPIENLERTLDLSEEDNKLPAWFGALPSYDAWYLDILYRYTLQTGKKDFFYRHLPYLQGLLKQFSACISQDGDIHYDLVNASTGNNGFFIDWPTAANKEEIKYTARYLLEYVFLKTKKLLKMENLDTSLLDDMLGRFKRVPDREIHRKPLLCFKALSGEVKPEDIYEELTHNGAEDFSTFMSYFILKPIAKVSLPRALELAKEYYGGMLDLGATTFFEDFSLKEGRESGRIDELPDPRKKDYHRDFGEYCYVGYRKSLCHGWSAGMVTLLREEVLGIEVKSIGAKEVSIHPNLGGLDYARGTFPTPYGNIEVELEKGKEPKIKVPDEVHVI